MQILQFLLHKKEKSSDEITTFWLFIFQEIIFRKCKKINVEEQCQCNENDPETVFFWPVVFEMLLSKVRRIQNSILKDTVESG